MKFKTYHFILALTFITLSTFSAYETNETKNITDGQKVIESPVFTKSSSSEQAIQAIESKAKNKFSEKILHNWAHWSCPKTQNLEDNYLLFCYKIDQSWGESRPDGYEITYLNGHPVATVRYKHIINPVYFYTNDYRQLKANQMFNLKKECVQATSIAAFSGAIIGALCALCAPQSVSKKNMMFAVMPSALTLAGMVYGIFHKKSNEYQRLSEEEYLALKRTHPSMDCDEFQIVRPHKNFYQELLASAGVAAAVGLTFFMIKSLIDKTTQPTKQ